jgi:DNA-binding Lrp family transcriptional regulator
VPKKVKPTAYVLINCDLDYKHEVMMNVGQLPGIIELADLDAAYDILVKLSVETFEELKETVKGHLRKMPHIRNTLVLVAIEPRGSYVEED